MRRFPPSFLPSYHHQSIPSLQRDQMEAFQLQPDLCTQIPKRKSWRYQTVPAPCLAPPPPPTLPSPPKIKEQICLQIKERDQPPPLHGHPLPFPLSSCDSPHSSW
ncbi:hypothetical protein XENTR_v10007224 [Xenopus tropicalis]|nr:hypothetical protein XENTR_v10007224 [Xenopus tropicalis]